MNLLMVARLSAFSRYGLLSPLWRFAPYAPGGQAIGCADTPAVRSLFAIRERIYYILFINSQMHSVHRIEYPHYREIIYIPQQMIYCDDDLSGDEENCKPYRKPGIAQRKFVYPDDIDADNEMIANRFERY